MKVLALQLLCVMSLIFTAFPAAADMAAQKSGMPAACNMNSQTCDCRDKCGCGNCRKTGGEMGPMMGMMDGMRGRMGMDGMGMMKCRMCHAAEGSSRMGGMMGPRMGMMGMGPMGPMGMMGGMGPMGMMGAPMMRTLKTPDYYLDRRDVLNLTDDQVENLAKLKENLREEAIMKGATVMVLELQLSDIVKDASFKLSDAEAKLKEIEAARLKLRMVVIKTASEARSILTKEQIEKLKKISLSGENCRMSYGGAKKDMMEKMMREKMENMK